MIDFWQRAAIVGSAAWIGCVVVWAAMKRVEWFVFWGMGTYRLGDASWVALAGVGVVCIICFGIPWVLRSK